MKKFLVLFLAFTLSPVAFAQDFFANKKVSKVTLVQTTVGTTAAVAIAPASVAGNFLGFKVCNNAVNTSTFLWVGNAADPATDGVQLGLGQCVSFDNAAKKVLIDLKVKAQATANGYSVIQYSGG